MSVEILFFVICFGKLEVDRWAMHGLNCTGSIEKWMAVEEGVALGYTVWGGGSMPRCVGKISSGLQMHKSYSTTQGVLEVAENAQRGCHRTRLPFSCASASMHLYECVCVRVFF